MAGMKINGINILYPARVIFDPLVVALALTVLEFQIKIVWATKKNANRTLLGLRNVRSEQPERPTSAAQYGG